MVSKKEIKLPHLYNGYVSQVNPIQNGGVQKIPPPTSFSPVTSTNEGANP